MKILIVGSGPSAAYAILACQACGVEPTVISNSQPHTNQAGAFFLHWLPEDFVHKTGAAAVEVYWIPLGDKRTYLAKQGYDDLALPCSFPDDLKVVPMYSSAWLDAAWHGVDVRLGELDVEDMVRMATTEFDFVFYTFPAVKHGRQLEQFPVVDARTTADYNVIVYNGTTGGNWVRMTMAFGRLSFEYAHEVRWYDLPQHQGLVFEKHLLREIPPRVLPLGASEYPAPNVIPIGRFAEWHRKRLSHEVYERVRLILSGATLEFVEGQNVG